MITSNRCIYLTVACAVVAASCGSDSGKKGGKGAGGTSGIVIGTDGAVIPGGATNPPPLPASNTNGWSDITQDQRNAMIGQGCAGGSAEPEGAPSILEFVLDVSGTMRATTGTTNGQSKWQACAAALRTAVAALPGNIAVGFEFFPNMNNGGAVPNPVCHPTCIDHGNDVAPAPLGAAGSTQRNALDAALTAVTPNANGATPTQDALDYAYGLLRQNTSQLSKYAVLITDGQPTLATGCCGRAAPANPEPTAPIVTDIGNVLSQDKIKTFIVGSPGSQRNEGTGADVRDWLSAAARAGGTSTPGCTDTGSPAYCHFDLSQTTDFGTALAGALNTIGQWVVGCDYTLPAQAPNGDPIDPNKVNLIYTDGTGQSHLLLPNGDPNCAVGWHYLDPPNYTQIHICGTTCSTIQGDSQARLDLVFGCTTGQPPVT
jgi:hypothetical protein